VKCGNLANLRGFLFLRPLPIVPEIESPQRYGRVPAGPCAIKNLLIMGIFTLQPLILSMAVGTVFGSSAAMANPNAITEIRFNNQDSAVIVEAPKSTIADLKKWIQKLKMAESEGRNDIKILDNNGQYSYGCLQFQEPTFRGYGAAYGLIDKDLENIEDAIFDCQLQEKLVLRMLLDDYDNWKHWKVTVRKIGMPPKVSHDLTYKN